MPSGAHHYREAERLLALADAQDDPAWCAAQATSAQAHATLAQVAALALIPLADADPDEVDEQLADAALSEWVAALGLAAAPDEPEAQH